MTTTDNIDAVIEAAEAVDKEAKRKEDARARAAASRLARKRSLPADAGTVAETVLLCLLDLNTLPPSRRAARAEVIGDVTRQVLRTLAAMGHPDVRTSWMSTVEAMAERLRTERWHHPLVHMAPKSTPGDTRVTPSARVPSPSDRIAGSTHGTDGVRGE